MRQGSQNKKKARQSQKKKGYYQTQGIRTGRNKLRRSKKRIARRAYWQAKGGQQGANAGQTTEV
jgi:hypothetical protein